MKVRSSIPCAFVAFVFFVLAAQAAPLSLKSYFGDGMVLQRDEAVKISGVTHADAQVLVSFGDQSKQTIAERDGTWSLTLDPMVADATGRPLTVRSAADVVKLDDVVVGDVLFFGRQTYVDISLDRDTEGRRAAQAYRPNGLLRALRIRTVAALDPQPALREDATTGWMIVTKDTARQMSAAAFFLGRDLSAELEVPIGIIDVDMGPYFGIGWLDDQTLKDIVTMYPTAKGIDWLPAWMRERAQARISGKAHEDLETYWENRVATARGRSPGVKPVLGLHPLENPMFPSGGFNAVIHPLEGITLKGVLLQLGNDYPFVAYRDLDKQGLATDIAELNAAWQENYLILKSGYRVSAYTHPFVPQAWRKALGTDDLPFGLILPPSSDLDVYAAHNREMRELHRRTAEGADKISLVMPGNENVPSSGQPADEALLAERSKAWALGALYRSADHTATGPVFARMEARISKATVYFKAGTAAGLMAHGGALQQFETAGPDRVFTPAKATIEGETIKLKSEGPIAFARYGWTYAPPQGLVNSAGLPATPFNTDTAWTFQWIPPAERPELPVEYSLTADKWGKSDVAIINGQIANMAQGDSEPIPRRPGPLGMIASPFGPNIYVVGTEAGAPAAGHLKTGDVIYGVNGKVFPDGPAASSDETYRQLADAISFSESDQGGGRLVFSLRRGATLMDVELELDVLGSYSSTTPYYCEKSENIVRNAEAWSSRRYRPEHGKVSEPTGMLGTDLLFLLASGTAEHQGLVRRAVYAIMDRMDPLEPVVRGTRSKPWHTGYQSMIIGEYFHATGDRNVLPYLRQLALLSAESQLKPKSETPPTKEAAQSEEQVGGWRQNYPGNPDRWQSGYGLMPHAGMTCVMGMILADEAGLDIDEVAMARGLKHFNEGRAEYGFVVYGYWNTHRDGPSAINPEAEAKGKLSSMNGKLGTAAALYRLVDDNDTVDICARHCVYGYNNTRGGHGGMFFNNLWTPIGAWAAGEHAYKHFMKGQTWWRELYRRHDGAFNQVGRGKVGVSYALHYVAPKQRLRMLGAPPSAFGTNAPDYLKPALAAHQARDYARCEALILEQINDYVRPAEDRPVIDHMLESVRILRASIEHDLTLTESLLAEGKHDYAHHELRQIKGVVAADNPRLVAIVAELESPEGQAALAAHRRQISEAERAAVAEAKAATPVRRKTSWGTAVPGTGSAWQMKVVESTTLAPKAWTEPDFDDSEWNTARLPISWTMYHTALFRRNFTINDPSEISALQVRGNFFQQQNVVIYLNGELVAKIDEIGRGTGDTKAPLTEGALSLLKEGENTIAISSRHKRRWGSYRGTYKTAATVHFAVEVAKATE